MTLTQARYVVREEATRQAVASDQTVAFHVYDLQEHRVVVFGDGYAKRYERTTVDELRHRAQKLANNMNSAMR